MKTIRSGNRKARKKHSCSYCQSDILAGETYHNQTNVFDGVVYDWKGCNHCKEIVEKMWKDRGDPWGYGRNDQDFWEYVSDENINFERKLKGRDKYE